MREEDSTPLLIDCSDSNTLATLYWRMSRRKHHRPTNAHQQAFFLAYEATDIINGDGFFSLLEQVPTLEDYGDSFVQIGMSQVKPILDRVIELIPRDVRPCHDKDGNWTAGNRNADWTRVRKKVAEPLYVLLSDFFTATELVDVVLCEYVRKHLADFSEFEVRCL